jgi:esterase/lipase/carbon monoxide dehydrogenase subunit G
MIEINEKFTVAAPPDQVYAVLSDPQAVVDCVAGASLGESHEDGSFDGMMTVKFSALRVVFRGRIKLDLDPEALSGTVVATGRDGQGGTKFKATAGFAVVAAEDGAGSEVTVSGEVDLSGKLASVIENAATAVVRRMTGEFVAALSMRCASGEATLGPAQPAAPVEGSTDAPAEPAPPAAAVLLLHGFGASPNSLRPWGEALAAAGMTVNIPRLPGHGTRWQDLNRSTEADWLKAAGEALTALRAEHPRVFLMGISLGATLAVRLAEQQPDAVAGVVAVNPVLAGLPGTSGVLRIIRRSVPANTETVKRSGVVDVGYKRIPLRAAGALRKLGAATLTDAAGVRVPVLVVTSAADRVVPPTQGKSLHDALPAAQRELLEVADSYHAVPLDNDAGALFDASVAFVRTHDLVTS